MPERKSFTELAMRKRRAAQDERDFKGGSLLPMYERQERACLNLDHPPDVGAGGEVVNPQPGPDENVVGEKVAIGHKRWVIADRLREGATRIAEDASLARTDLLMQPSFNAVAMGIDAAQSVGAQNSLEKMLAHQMAVAHEATMRLMDRALSFEASHDGGEACRLANAAARLMSVYQDGLMTLQRLRTGGTQTVTVQHVNVEAGAQAVIGNVAAGGAKGEGGR